MKEIIILQDKLTLVEQELRTYTETLNALEAKVRDLKDLEAEIKALKVFLGRVHPDFKSQFLEITKKLSG
jgi:hypothetical protein